MSEQPLISVIIPVYKTEKFLNRCVESVVNQTYKDLEIILVDDGSPDRCPDICDEWAAKDTRIKVIHKENGGAADAKNVGLDSATGEYIALVDSDDLIVPNMYEDMLELMSKYDADIVDSIIEKTDSTDKISGYKSNRHITLYSAEDALSVYMDDSTIRQTPVNKLYKKRVIGGIRFPKGKYIDDEYWTYKVIGNAANYVFTDSVYYYYLQHSESAMGKDYSLNRLDALDALMERVNYMKELFPNLVPKAEKSYFGSCRFHFQMLCYYSELDPRKTYRKEILNRIKTLDEELVISLYHGKYKMWAKAFMAAPYMTSRVRNIFRIGW